MSWEDRILEAAYTSPSGVRFTFDYEDVGRQIRKKTSAYDFADTNGTYVKDGGLSGERIPLEMIFWGENYDLAAKVAESALSENGAGTLEHPAYGTLLVVPYGTIERVDRLKTAANQAVISVEFWETIPSLYESVAQNDGSATLEAVRAYNEAASEELGRALDASTTVKQSAILTRYNALLASAKAALKPIADTLDATRRQFDAITASVDAGVAVLVADPLALASQTVLLVQAPARSLSSIRAKLSAYATLASQIVGGTIAPSYNDFRTRDMYASAYVTGSVLSAVNATFTTRGEALAAASSILGQFDAVVAWRDVNYQALNETDTGELYQGLQNAVATAAGYLIGVAFSLKQERAMTLTRARTALDLVAELYGVVDEQLDFFIASNKLVGLEILEIPAGRRVVYYV